MEPFHRFAATGTGDRELGFSGGLNQGADPQWPPGVEGDTFAFEFSRGMAKAEVTNCAQASRQDMTEVSAYKLGAGDRLNFLFVTVGSVFPAETEVGVGDVYEAGIADGGTGDIAAQVADDIFPGTEGLQIHAPFLFPNAGIDCGKVVVFGQIRELVAEAGAEEFLDGVEGNEIFVTFDGDHAALGVNSSTGHDAVDVGVKKQPLVPGMEHH